MPGKEIYETINYQPSLTTKVICRQQGAVVVSLSGAGALSPPVDLSSYGRPSGSTALIALIDPRELTRHCLKRWLQEAWPGYHVLAVPKVRELADQMRRPADLRFALVGVPAGQVLAPETLAAIAQLRRALDDKPVIVLAENEEPDEIVATIRAGARGYVPTSLDRTAAVEAIRFILAGGTFVPAGVIAEDASSGLGTGQRRITSAPQLSPRELEVAARLREGKSNKAIAYELAISESTVKVFVRRILTKFGVANRTEAAILIERHLLGVAGGDGSRMPATTSPVKD